MNENSQMNQRLQLALIKLTESDSDKSKIKLVPEGVVHLGALDNSSLLIQLLTEIVEEQVKYEVVDTTTR